ncbi:MAG: formimidoylglutamase [Candidatus Aminicenantes bacterium]
MSVFELTERPDPDLLKGSHDPKDLRIGEVVKHKPRDYDSAGVVILGCPEDEGVRRNKGRPGARKSPAEIRRSLYKLTSNPVIQSLKVFDLGDIMVDDTLEKTHKKLKQVVRTVLSDGKMAVVLGGGNDISYPDCAALADVKENLLVFNIDKHFDVRDLTPRNSGTSYRMLLEENLIQPDKFYEMGSEHFSNSQVYKDYLKEKGVHVFTLNQMREKGIKSLFQEIIHGHSFEAIFWGVDLDVVRDADAPGVSASYPTGLTAKEMIQIAETAGRETPFGVVEFTEVNPEFDIDNRTSKLTAILIHTFLSSRNL